MTQDVRWSPKVDWLDRPRNIAIVAVVIVGALVGAGVLGWVPKSTTPPATLLTTQPAALTIILQPGDILTVTRPTAPAPVTPPPAPSAHPAPP